MKTTKKELKRIAALCFLDFSDEEYCLLQDSLEKSTESIELLFSSDENHCDDGKIYSESFFERTAKNSFSFTKKDKNNAN